MYRIVTAAFVIVAAALTATGCSATAATSSSVLSSASTPAAATASSAAAVATASASGDGSPTLASESTAEAALSIADACDAVWVIAHEDIEGEDNEGELRIDQADRVVAILARTATDIPAPITRYATQLRSYGATLVAVDNDTENSGLDHLGTLLEAQGRFEDQIPRLVKACRTNGAVMEGWD